MDLDGKVVLVTGSGRRVGRAIAEELGSAGATVVLHYNASRVGASEVAARIPRSVVVRADLRTFDGCRSLIELVRQRCSKLDVLVNSAADYARGPFAYESDELWEKMMALNVMAPMRLTRMSLALGISSVVNILDVAALNPWAHHAAYATSKAALAHMTRCLALELAPAIRVNGVLPGTVAFPPDFSEAERQGIVRRIPLGHVGEPTDVARAVRFLVEQDYLTGVLLPVDGGAALA